MTTNYLFDIVLLSTVASGKHKYRSINKIIWSLNLTLLHKEHIRKRLISLKQRGYLNTRTNKQGIDKWFITTEGLIFAQL